MNLTILEAYKAMFTFLERYYDETKSDDVGGLLGEMNILSDGKTADPAAWIDWLDAVKKIKETY